MLKRKSQSWSIDISIGVVIFMAAFFLGYSIIGQNDDAKLKGLQKESVKIIDQVTSEDSLLKVVENNELSTDRLSELKNMSYTELRSRLKVQGDFCIYVEDEAGNIIEIDDGISPYRAIGSDKITVADTPCQ